MAKFVRRNEHLSPFLYQLNPGKGRGGGAQLWEPICSFQIGWIY
jgi:hypothetical protein